MGKNTIGGKKHKRSKNITQPCNISRPLTLIDPDSEKYGYVMSAMGDCRMRCYCEDQKERIGIIRGNMRKRTYVSIGDIVILSMRSFQDDKADIRHIYNSDEVIQLTNYGEIKNINKYKTMNVNRYDIQINKNNGSDSESDSEFTFSENPIRKNKSNELQFQTNESENVSIDFDEI